MRRCSAARPGAAAPPPERGDRLTGETTARAGAESAVGTGPGTGDPRPARAGLPGGPRAETPRAETPRAETPRAETPWAETPWAETPWAETPWAETPWAETPWVTGRHRPECRRPARRPARPWVTGTLAALGTACLVAGAVVLVTDPWAPGPVDIGTMPVAAAPAAPAAAPAAAAVPTPPVARTPAPPAGTVPVRLSLPSRSVAARVVPVGTDATGGLAIPDPPSVVGWWRPSALAGGRAGPTVLAGHVDSRVAGLGALSVLRQVELGDPVVLQGADGRVLRYVVTGRREYVKADLPASVFDPAGRGGLVLITCGGRFDTATRHYEDNVVVEAVPA